MKPLVQLVMLVALVSLYEAASAEPYLAVKSGLKCGACHTNPTGGGQRSAFGNLYAQQQLTADPAAPDDPWTGELLTRLTVGSDARVSARQFELDDRDDNLQFDVDRVTAYGAAQVNAQVLLYVDQQVAPGGSSTREAWIKLDWQDFYLKAGRMFLPFGWRLEDDTALVREATGISMNQGDDGVEFGYLRGRFDAQLGITNGAGGGADTDDGKLFTSRLAWTESSWQLGVSAYHNNTDFEDRTMLGLFGGLNTGPVTWLTEVDYIDDDGNDGEDQQLWAALLEANWQIAQGHNLKISLETLRFDDDLEDRDRGSLVYELFPWPFTQLSLGVRARDSDSDEAFLNSEEAFIQLHAFF